MLDVIQKLSEDEILHGKDKNGTPYLRYVFELHKKLFGTTCSSCPGKIRGYIRKIKDYQNPETMATEKKEKTQKYIMREGATISILGTNKVYSRHNLNDKLALKLLKANPKRKVLFTKLPDNVHKLINKTTSDEGSKTEGNEAKEVRKAELEELHYTKLQEILEGYEEEYTNKDNAIDLIISHEFAKKDEQTIPKSTGKDENADEKEKQIQQRKKELDELHYTKLQALVESYDEAYKNKEKAIELILSKEFES